MTTYYIQSKSDKDRHYKVTLGLFGNYCECMAYHFSKDQTCKHIDEAKHIMVGGLNLKTKT